MKKNYFERIYADLIKNCPEQNPLILDMDKQKAIIMEHANKTALIVFSEDKKEIVGISVFENISETESKGVYP